MGSGSNLRPTLPHLECLYVRNSNITAGKCLLRATHGAEWLSGEFPWLCRDPAELGRGLGPPL